MGRRRKSRSAKGKGLRLVDPGPDEGGRYSPSPYALQHGHMVETAPKSLGSELPKDSAFPKRIATQRMIDRYFRAGHIEARQWKAADALWQLWCAAGLEASVVSRYSGMSGKGSSYTAPFEGRADSAAQYLAAMSAVPYRCRGCVIHVVVTDWPASDWARGRGLRGRDSESHGMERLRAGLSALALHFGY